MQRLSRTSPAQLKHPKGLLGVLITLSAANPLQSRARIPKDAAKAPKFDGHFPLMLRETACIRSWHEINQMRCDVSCHRHLMYAA